MPPKLKVIIAENHPIYRDGLYSLITSFDEIGHVELSVDGNDFLSKISNADFDLAIVDIKMPGKDGIEAILEARKSNKNLKFIVISGFESADYVERAIAAGASAYLLKDSEPWEINNTIELVINGGTHFSPKILDGITNRLRDRMNNINQEVSINELTGREIEILRFISLGQSRPEIAKKLFISERTVDKHRENIMMKTKTTNAVEMAHFAIKNKLIDIQL